MSHEFKLGVENRMLVNRPVRKHQWMQNKIPRWSVFSNWLIDQEWDQSQWNSDCHSCTTISILLFWFVDWSKAKADFSSLYYDLILHMALYFHAVLKVDKWFGSSIYFHFVAVYFQKNESTSFKKGYFQGLITMIFYYFIESGFQKI